MMIRLILRVMVVKILLAQIDSLVLENKLSMNINKKILKKRSRRPMENPKLHKALAPLSCKVSAMLQTSNMTK
jgi:hypothetical protein